MITNGDDCSASPGVPLSTRRRARPMSKLGSSGPSAATSWPHLRRRPPRSPRAERRRERHAHLRQLRVGRGRRAAQRRATSPRGIKALKTDAATTRIVFAAISGLADAVHGALERRRQAIDTQARGPRSRTPASAADGSYADPVAARQPARRTSSAPNGLQLDICGGEFYGARCSRIADKIADHIRKPCISGQVAEDRDGDRRLARWRRFSPDDDGKRRRTPHGRLRRTPAAWARAGSSPPATPACGGQTIAVVPDPAVPPPIWENAAVQCALCAPGVTDAARGCP